MFKILSINPGSTSTKIAYFEDENLIFEKKFTHTSEELKGFDKVADQYEFRKNLILEFMKSEKISDLSAIVGRGGLIRPIESGAYEVNDKMLNDLVHAKEEHASNLGGIIARELASEIPGCKVFIADPIVVDELQDVARISGIPEIPRRSIFHALNQKATARKYAKERGIPYESLNLVIAHLGGGISVAAHQNGKVIDTNQAVGGYGAFSPERAGTIDASMLARLCFSGKYTQDEILKLICGKGGLAAHLGTNEAHIAAERAYSGDEQAKLVLEAMSYTIAKEIGAMHVVLKGKTDALILTGGIANNRFVVEYVTDMIKHLAPVIVYPGEDEMGALAMSGLRVLRGEPAKEY